MNLKIWFYFQRAWNWSGAWKEEADDAGEVVVEEVVVLLLLLLVLLLLLLVRHWEGSQCCKGGNPSLPSLSPNTPYYLLAHFVHALLGRLSSPKWMKFRTISLQIFIWFNLLVGGIGRSLRSCRKSVLERHQKSDASQGEKNNFFFFPS